MKALWQWIGTRASYRVASALALIYLSIAELGRSGSWVQATGQAMLFYAIWSLGKGSVAAPEKGGAA
jgi:hypothetical protein